MPCLASFSLFPLSEARSRQSGEVGFDVRVWPRRSGRPDNSRISNGRHVLTSCLELAFKAVESPNEDWERDPV